MSDLILRINEFINRAELEIIEKIEQRFSTILNDSIQQLKLFPNLSINKFSTQTNRLIVQLINELSFCFWRLIEIIMEYSYYIQQQSPNNLHQLNTMENLLLSHIDLLNQFHQRHADLISQSSSNSSIEYDQEIYNELSRIANEVCHQLSTISLPNYTIGIIGDA
jgi:hypothetical protein